MELSYQDKVLEVVPTNDARGWYMTVDAVASGYGVDRTTVMTHLRDHKNEIRDGIEKGVGITNTLGGPQERAILYRDGVIKLGFFIRSPQSAMFRQWATDVIVGHMETQGITMQMLFDQMNRRFDEQNQRMDRQQDEIEELRTMVGLILNSKEQAEIRALIREVKTTLNMDGRKIVGHIKKSLGINSPYKEVTFAIVKNLLNNMLGRGLTTVL